MERSWRKFERLKGIAAPLPLANVDTDMIIPARFMTALTRQGLGRHLFQELRYDAQGVERDAFVLNRAPYRDAQILIADRNFGCGSSREHAVWALTDFGIRCVVAPSFGDIFANNARKNGLLLIRLPDAECARLQRAASMADMALIDVDLDRQMISLADGESTGFSIDPDDRHALLEGLDDIARTLRHAEAIARYEARA